MREREDQIAVVTTRGAARVRGGHPWVYRDDVARGPSHDAGDGGPALVAVVDARGKRLGTATWAARARLALRMKRTYLAVSEYAAVRKCDWRVAAMAIALERVGKAYAERGIFP